MSTELSQLSYSLIRKLLSAKRATLHQHRLSFKYDSGQINIQDIPISNNKNIIWSRYTVIMTGGYSSVASMKLISWLFEPLQIIRYIEVDKKTNCTVGWMAVLLIGQPNIFVIFVIQRLSNISIVITKMRSRFVWNFWK